ncbi:cytochrome P450 [Sphingomonas yabuuchiae]
MRIIRNKTAPSPKRSGRRYVELTLTDKVDLPMPQIPRTGSFDSTLALLREGYDFISNRCARYGSNAFETRLMLRRVTCVTGEEAARMFYEPGRFTRRGAIPQPTLRLLQDVGSVATLDGEKHRHRKAMFLSLMTPTSVRQIGEIFINEWQRRLPQWEAKERIVLFQEIQPILCSAVARWAGTPLRGKELEARTREFAAMIDGAGSAGPRQWRGAWLRRRTERWGRRVIDEIRSGARAVPDESPAAVIARHRDLSGHPLSTSDAAVELINLLRPTFAVDRFIVFAALALVEHPDARAFVTGGENERLEAFAQEVRRYYPFFPVVGGRALEPFGWRGRGFRKGDWVLLDLYGTNHDERIWEDPNSFRPKRFLEWDNNPYSFIPQGGGDVRSNHRCPGEPITVEIIKRAIDMLANRLDYDLPPQDLSVSRSRMPAVPKSRLVITNVRPRN